MTEFTKPMVGDTLRKIHVGRYSSISSVGDFPEYVVTKVARKYGAAVLAREQRKYISGERKHLPREEKFDLDDGLIPEGGYSPAFRFATVDQLRREAEVEAIRGRIKEAGLSDPYWQANRISLECLREIDAVLVKHGYLVEQGATSEEGDQSCQS